MVKILMVCLGNICRSPLAEGIMKKKLEDNNIEGFVDSCGFESFHTGDSPDRRSVETAAKHGVDISKQRSRLFKVEDFDKFDKIYVMDKNNYRDVSAVARNEDDLKKVDLIMNVLHPGSGMPVPDPYYGGQSGFRKTWELLDQATDVIIEQIIGNKFPKNDS
ncbi:MAG: protein-tyrosine-phosphatase [Bacteroidetes bacterium HGW-Bacteroidetes-11]|nr:MAG: protein-tyrosine-phosphatase [Bacteroidetes bacterium HGW-Bacteroidetes-11]